MRSANTLGKYLRTRLQAIVLELGEIELDEIRRDDGLKSNLIEDPLYSIQLVSGNSFKVVAQPADITKALLRDFLFGAHRVDQQWQGTRLLAERGLTAWALVSSYYCAFFGAIESLRLCGIHTLTLTAEESDRLFSKAGAPHAAPIRAHRNFRGKIAGDLSSIGYTANGEKPHQSTWRQLASDVFSIVPNSESSWVDLSKFSQMCLSSSGWELPSEIRNRWNYRDSLYFSRLGTSSSNPFLGLLLKESSESSSWIKGKTGIRNENDSAASVAALTRLLHLAIEDTVKFGVYSAKNIAF
jgi:hypothetical protein